MGRFKLEMKFATLALIGNAAAQAPPCESGGCDPSVFGEGSCCNQLTAVEAVADGTYGAFSQYIWGLAEGEALTSGHSVTLCVPQAYVDAHAKAEEESGKATMSAVQNLQIVLDTVPNVRESY